MSKKLRKLLFTLALVIAMLACTSSQNVENNSQYTCAVSNEAAAHSTVLKQYGERSPDSVKLPNESSKRIFGLYMRALRSNREFGGKIVFRVSVRGDGEVIGFSTAHSDISDCEFIANVAKEFQHLRFNAINNRDDISEFLFPINFASG